MQTNKNIAILLGIISALFFAITFVFNRLMTVQGSHWIWSSSLRYFWTALLLFILVLFSKKLTPVMMAIKEKPAQRLLWSTIGFGLHWNTVTPQLRQVLELMMREPLFDSFR